MSNTTITENNAIELAAQINEVVNAGTDITVNGHTPVKAWGSNAARAWGNGTVSIKVRAKAKGKFNDIFFKAGMPVTILHPVTI